MVEKKEVKSEVKQEPTPSGSKITHKGFAADSNVQNIVRYAYQLGWYDFVAVLECENWSYDLNARGDNWHSRSLCQVNDRYHKDIPSDFTTNRVVAVEYCYSKRKKLNKILLTKPYS